MRIVRLGEGVDRTGSLAPQAIERTRVALAEYAAMVADRDVARVRMVATSATRDADNRADFVSMVRDDARCRARGDHRPRRGVAVVRRRGRHAAGRRRGDVLLADIGGGSTELVLGGRGELRAYSMDVGCVRMTERHLRDDPPTEQQIAAVVADLHAALDEAAQHVPIDTGATLVGVAGTVTTIAAIALGLDHYDPDAIHASRISAAQVADVTARLLAMTHEQRAALPVMHPGRVDVIGGGALVLRTLVERCAADDVVVSEHDILDGIALSLR